jgi:hypothetical protein
MPLKEVAGLFAEFLEGSESTGCGNDLAELEWIPHLDSSQHLYPSIGCRLRWLIESLTRELA